MTPVGSHLTTWCTVEFIHRQITNDAVVMEDAEALETVCFGEHKDLALPLVSDLLESRKIVLLDGHDHALLGLGDEDLPAFQAGLFQRAMVEVNLATDLAEHFARGAGSSKAKRSKAGEGTYGCPSPKMD